jgi:uncharacterized protein (UPF0210 family)
VRSTVEETAEAVREKIERTAARLVPTVNEIGEEYGLRIANKRISITPASLVFDRARRGSELLPLARAIDEAAKRVGVDFIGGYSALVHKGSTRFAASSIARASGINSSGRLTRPDRSEAGVIEMRLFAMRSPSSSPISSTVETRRAAIVSIFSRAASAVS